jgi:hypothetical protein
VSIDVSIGALRQSLEGVVLAPGDTDYDAARVCFNALVDRRPAVIVRCIGAEDIATAFDYARSHDLEVAVRGGGHNPAGHCVLDDGLVIDLSAMRRVEVDPDARVARAQGGSTWSDFDTSTQAFGLVTPGGVVVSTGVAGLTFGGGIGHLTAQHGLTCDNLVGAELVVPDGSVVQVTEHENAELLYGLRGGGGNFGVATAFELRAHPVGPVVFGGPMIWPATDASRVLEAYVELCRDLPDELSLFAALVTSPLDLQPVVAIAAGWFGPLDRAAAALAPVRALAPMADMTGPLPYLSLQTMSDAALPHGMARYWKSGFFDELPPDAIDAIAGAHDRKPTPISVELFFHQHGAATRVAPDATAFPHRGVSWDFDAVAQWTEPQHATGGIAWAHDLWQELASFSDGVYVNHLDADDRGRVASAYGPNYERLASSNKSTTPTTSSD